MKRFFLVVAAVWFRWCELGALTPGPVDLLVARERTDRVQFTDGGLTVLSRFERWGFLDLF